MQRVSIHIRGIVQGVGFRPFIHREVGRFGLKGFIKNSSSGVELELEGEREKLEAFIRELPENAPRLAVIEHIRTEYSDELKGFEEFSILQSKTEHERQTLISPDICICEDCLRELRDKNDRRYGYPFINCTNCGPRFTIIRDIPYDRAMTSMRDFPMCPDCEREYTDIADRRYHAQPDCCQSCGPEVFYLNERGERLHGEAIETARERLKAGGIVAIKGLGGIHLACRVDDEGVVKALRRRKQRDEKPFAIMCRDCAAAEKLCHVSEGERKILEGHQRPIVLLRKKQAGLGHISENGYIGVMLPYTPLHYLLFGDDIEMLVMTSANLSDTPMLIGNDEAVEKLRGIADGYLLHNRDIQTRCDDSLCWVREGREYFARRSRGYVPFPLTTEKPMRQILACGAEQKASFCISKGNYAFMSQHIGDLKNLETLENYEGQISHFKRLFDIEPEIIVSDLHPDYMSSCYAEESGLRHVKVQHHHAHMAACMADNAHDGKAIGLIWDGVGLGTDAEAWGAECLTGDYRGFERFGSILPMALPGGDRAAKEAERIAFSLLYASGLDTAHIPGHESFEAMIKSGLNCPKSSGMGRLFDGVSAILGIRKLCSYEGQAAILLEAAAAEDEKGLYPISFTGEIMRFDWREMIKAIVSDTEKGVDPGLISARFMNTVIRMAVIQAMAAREKSSVNTICLSGGSFQNMYIMHRLPNALEREGFNVLTHHRVSPNDEGLSLGQLMIANALCEE